MRVLACIIVLAIAVASCGGDSESVDEDAPLLLFEDGTQDSWSISEWRTTIRASFIETGTDAELLCDRLDGLSSREIMDIMLALGDAPTEITERTMIPTAVETVADVIRDECDRIR
jgi:hypothetical protein